VSFVAFPIPRNLTTNETTRYTEMQPAPPVPDHLADKPCVWGYRLSDELFRAYEQPQPQPPSEEKKVSVRYNTVFWTSEKLEMKPMVDFVMGSTLDDAYVIWSRHFPTSGIPAPEIPCAEKLEMLKREMKFKEDGQWFIHPRFVGYQGAA
jgi:hypothetical protein